MTGLSTPSGGRLKPSAGFAVRWRCGFCWGQAYSPSKPWLENFGVLQFSVTVRRTCFGVICIAEDAVAERCADLVVEATGSPSGLTLAKRAVRPGGTIVLKSTYKDNIEVDISAIVVDEIRLVGSRCGPFPAAVRLLEHRLVDPLPLIDARFSLQQGVGALRQAAEPGRLKVLAHP